MARPIMCLMAILGSPKPVAAESAGGLGLFYGAPVPTEALSFIGQVVLDPDRATDREVATLATQGCKVLARLSVAGDPSTARIETNLKRTAALAARGYVGFLIEGKSSRDNQRTEIAIIEALHRAQPGAVLWLASESHPTIERLAPLLSGVVVDSLFFRWDSHTRQGQPVPDAEHLTRVHDLQAVMRVHKIPLVAHEATPAGGREQARQLARRIVSEGFIPWVTPPGNDHVGIGLIEPVPRRILVLVDGKEEPYLPETLAHQSLALPLEYLGYALDYLDIRQGLPQDPIENRYAGIVTWFTDDTMPRQDKFQRWLERQWEAGLHVAIIGSLGFTPEAGFLKRIGIEALAPDVVPPVKVQNSDKLIGFETPPVPLARGFPAWSAPSLSRHLELSDGAGRRLTAVATGWWGGFALTPYVLSEEFQGRHRWIVDPFAFLARALQLPLIPAPDPTSENGLRLLEIHIDGDGFVSKAEMPAHRDVFAGEVMLQEILRQYRLPTTVSVIEGETGAGGLYPDLSPKLESIASKIFALPHVEVASHSFSHPFDWRRVAGVAKRADPDGGDDDGPSSLAIPNYRYSPEREVAGSIQYINGHLVTGGKRARVMLWSGTAQPQEDAIAVADRIGVYNVNGFNAEEPGDVPTLAQVPSWTRPVGFHRQVYAPGQNENVYTNLWHGPFYGFARVIDMFQFTEMPRRLKPIGIYYHFYSATKTASLVALKQVYAWALDREPHPVWVSEYAAKVLDFEGVRLARWLDGGWELRGFSALRTVRLPVGLGWPDLAHSRGVVGASEIPQGRYGALSGDPQVTLRLQEQRSNEPSLLTSNASVDSWQSDQRGAVKFRLRGHVPVVARIGACADPVRITGTFAHVGRLPNGAGIKLKFAGSDTGPMELKCW